jgi:hypothetical protein
MDSAVKPIAVVQGAPSVVVQQLFRDFVGRWRPSCRLAGLIEAAEGEGDGVCGPGQLLSIADGQPYPLFQDLGTGSAACALDATGVVDAGEAVRRDIAAGCDLVLLSKFGKLEAESRSGLISAFSAAIEAGVPILTSVSPKFADAWARFADPLFVTLPADARAIDDWWGAARALRA